MRGLSGFKLIGLGFRSYASSNDCRNDGLPDAGVADCIIRCGLVKQGENQLHY